ncbi:substrate-binding domain-containing protein [Parasalinivibrio latis]|uniref:substrate-binding domain-containing protein n=1 Tax=Parasalinivibrio latis TaxID=2952610 RepID=UPI0030E5B0D8
MKIRSAIYLIVAVITTVVLLPIRPVFAANPAVNSITVKAGISVSDLTNPYFVTMVRSIQDELSRHTGNASFIVRSSAYNLDRQIRQLDEFVAEKVDIIFLAATDEFQINDAVLNAREAGIPVVAVDVRAQGADFAVTTDNVQAGQVACSNLAEYIQGRGNVVIINGPPVSSVIERVSGCKRVLADYPAIRIVSDSLNGTASYEGGLEAMAYALEAYQSISGVFTINDPTALGAEQAIRQSGKEVYIVSVDGSALAIDALKEARPYWLGTASQSPDKMSRRAVQVALDILKGTPPDNDVILIPSKFISRQNIPTP